MGERALGLGVLAFGVIYLALSLLLPIWTLNGPGPGVFPLVVAAVLVLTGAVAATMPEAPYGKREAAAAPWAPVLILASLVLFCLLFQLLGYIASGIMVSILVLRAFDASWRLALPVAVGGVVACWIIFVPLLGLALPRGVWTPF